MKQKLRVRIQQSAALLLLLAGTPSFAATATPVSSSSTTTIQRSSPGSSTVMPVEGAPRARRAVKSKVNKKVGVQAPKAGAYTFSAVLKNTMTFGRKYELEEVGGKNYYLKNELILGVKHKSGWGLAVADHVDQSNYNDPSQNKPVKVKDASLLFSHPAIVKNDFMELGGYLRPYIPTSTSSRENGRRQLRYYSFADFKMPGKWGLSNLALPMFFHSDVMAPTDADFLMLESLELTHQTAKSVRFGIGQQTQWEHHVGSASGTVVDIYPFADLEFIPNVLIEPKIYLPVFVRGLVDDAAQSASLAQSQFELFVKIGF
jgi:hypothetical protein